MSTILNLKRWVVVAGKTSDKDRQDARVDEGVDWRVPVGRKKLSRRLETKQEKQFKLTSEKKHLCSKNGLRLLHEPWN